METPTCALMEILPMILIRAGGLPFSAWQSLSSSELLGTEASTEVATAAQRVRDSFDRVLAVLPPSDFRTGIYNARKAFFQKSKMPSVHLQDLINARPSGPELIALGQQLELWKSVKERQPQVEELYAQGLEREWEGIQQVARTPWIRQALLFASHDLLRQLPAFCSKEVSAFDKKDRQTARSLIQYMSRSIFKTSPLGRFTTVQLWRLDQEQQRDFLDEKIAVTPSVAMLPAIYEVLLREPAFFQSLDVHLNPSIPSHYSGGELTWLYFDGEQEAFQRLESHPVAAIIVRYLLDHQRHLPYSKLMRWLSEEVAASNVELEALILELIGFGLLEWQLPEKGMSPSWCSNLCQYLSFLPSAPVLTEAAFLLQSLRVSARAMSFQRVEEAQITQEGAKQQLEDFMRRFEGVAPPIPVEQIFFQDVEKAQVNHCPETALRQFASDLAACWNRDADQVLPEFPSRLVHFTEGHMKVGETIDFQSFCASFIHSDTVAAPRVSKRYQGKMGAMIQVYQEQGRFRAVVNAMFPGGGKLFARWMHLFPADFRDAVEAWNDPELVFFPWQGWSNANFQSISTGATLIVPDGRVAGDSRHKKLFLSDLGVKRGVDGPELVDKSTGKRVILKDLGLEAPSSRPPVIQILWHLGVPMVSSQSLIQSQEWLPMASGVKMRQRINYESLVLARAAWECPAAIFHPLQTTNQTALTRYLHLKQVLVDLGVPCYFFARPTGLRQKPQFYDQQSLVSMQLFGKMVASVVTEGSMIWLEEMLPTPDQWVLGAGEGYVGETIIEYLSI